MKPQTRAVLELLRTRGSSGVTALDALEEVRSFRLAARIQELEAEGFLVRSALVTNNGKRYSRYWLVEHPEQLGLPL